MTVFVWKRVDECSERYHCEGGIVVFAENEERARTIASERPGCVIQKEEKPDDVRKVTSGKEAVYIMPDAGCC